MIVNKRKQHGVTLMELLVAIAIISILAALAVPAYQDYVRRANKAAAQAFMMDMANRQAQFILDTRFYADTLAVLGMYTTIPDRADDFYTFTIREIDDSALDADPANQPIPREYEIVATPRAGTMQAGEATLTLDSTGVKGPAGEWE